MFGFIIGIIVGLAFGWNLPQPKWAKDLQNKVIKPTDDSV
jgi:hypothetical protein